jgi:hypothetical protein
VSRGSAHEAKRAARRGDDLVGRRHDVPMVNLGETIRAQLFAEK